MNWDLTWIMIRLLLIIVFLGIGVALAVGIWRHGQTTAALCPHCGVAVPLSRAKANQQCRNCKTALVKNYVPLPGINPIKVSASDRN